MKFIVAFVAIVAVAVANPLKPYNDDHAQLEAIIAAIDSPNTDPVTAALLEEQLAAIVAVTSPIAVGAPIIETVPIAIGAPIIETSPIAVGAPIVDFPMPDGGALTAEEPAIVGPSPVVAPSPVIQPSPVVIGEIPTGSSPLVQIVVNINKNAAESVDAPTPVVTPVVTPVLEEPIVPGPVNIVDQPDVSPSVDPIQVVNPIVQEPVVPGPVNIVEGPDAPTVEPIQVVNPVVVEPVIIGTPILPAPAVVLPEELN